MVPRGGIEPPTQGFSVILIIEQVEDLESLARNMIKNFSLRIPVSAKQSIY